jgi:hypothetical protein
VDHAVAERRIVAEEQAERGEEHQQQREQREHAVVGEEGGQGRTAVLDVLARDADDEGHRGMTALVVVETTNELLDQDHLLRDDHKLNGSLERAPRRSV